MSSMITRVKGSVRNPLTGALTLGGSLIVAAAGAPRAQGPADPNAIGTGQIAATSTIPDAVPFTIWQGMMVLKAHVGDAGAEIDVAVDTGLPICFATSDYAKQQNMITDGLRDVELLDRSVRVEKTKPVNLKFGRVGVSAVPFAIYDLPSKLSGAAPAANAPQVWLGNSALAAFTVTVDPTAQKVQFSAPRAQMPKKATLVPFELKDGQIWVDAKVNGKQTFHALVDTGSVGTLTTASVVNALKLKPAKTLTFTQPNGKPGKVGAVQLGDVRLGDLKVSDVQALYVAEGDKDGLDPDFGIIGNDILMRYRVTIDYGNHQLAFEPLPKPGSTNNPQQPGNPINNGTGPFRPGGGRFPFPNVPNQPYNLPTQPFNPTIQPNVGPQPAGQ